MMEVLQNLSARMSAVEDAQEIHVDNFRAIIARQCLFRFHLLVFLQDLVLFQHLPDQGGQGFHQKIADEDEELVRDRLPQSFTSHRDLVERDIVDARSLRYATLGPVPSSASDFRAWKNQVLLIMAKLDISDRDYLAHWLFKAYEVNSDEVTKHDSACVLRLDCWLAAEISKGCENVPELQFKIMGYIEGCTRIANPPRGRYLLHIVSSILTLIALVVRCLLRNRSFKWGLMVTVPSICKSFQVVSFALCVVCRRKIGRLSA